MPPTDEVLVHARGLTKRFDAMTAVNAVDFDVRTAEAFGFLGPNGAGKSTAIRLLLGFLHPTSGSATVLGLDAVRDSVEIRRRIGYLPGGIALYDSLTGERLLDYLVALTGRPPSRRSAHRPPVSRWPGAPAWRPPPNRPRR